MTFTATDMESYLKCGIRMIISMLLTSFSTFYIVIISEKIRTKRLTDSPVNLFTSYAVLGFFGVGRPHIDHGQSNLIPVIQRPRSTVTEHPFGCIYNGIMTTCYVTDLREIHKQPINRSLMWLDFSVSKSLLLDLSIRSSSSTGTRPVPKI